jgi:response regulator RpfG family c-di-GMP phosphodiesterase
MSKKILVIEDDHVVSDLIKELLLANGMDSQSVFQAMDLGSYDYLIKPIKMKELLGVVLKAIRLSERKNHYA